MKTGNLETLRRRNLKLLHEFEIKGNNLHSLIYFALKWKSQNILV